jgi:hypothetical protein
VTIVRDWLLLYSSVLERVSSHILPTPESPINDWTQSSSAMAAVNRHLIELTSTTLLRSQLPQFEYAHRISRPRVECPGPSNSELQLDSVFRDRWYRVFDIDPDPHHLRVLSEKDSGVKSRVLGVISPCGARLSE